MTLAQWKDQPGVSDLPTKTRSYFAGALFKEEHGNREKAEEYLDKAVAAEAAERAAS